MPLERDYHSEESVQSILTKIRRGKIPPSQRGDLEGRKRIKVDAGKAWRFIERNYGINPRNLKEHNLRLTSTVLLVLDELLNDAGSIDQNDILTMVVVLDQTDQPVLIAEKPPWSVAGTTIFQFIPGLEPIPDMRQNADIGLIWVEDDRRDISQWSGQEPPPGISGHFEVRFKDKGQWAPEIVKLATQYEGVVGFEETTPVLYKKQRGTHFLRIELIGAETMMDLSRQAEGEFAGQNAVNLFNHLHQAVSLSH